MIYVVFSRFVFYSIEISFCGGVFYRVVLGSHFERHFAEFVSQENPHIANVSATSLMSIPVKSVEVAIPLTHAKESSVHSTPQVTKLSLISSKVTGNDQAFCITESRHKKANSFIIM